MSTYGFESNRIISGMRLFASNNKEEYTSDINRGFIADAVRIEWKVFSGNISYATGDTPEIRITLWSSLPPLKSSYNLEIKTYSKSGLKDRWFVKDFMKKITVAPVLPSPLESYFDIANQLLFEYFNIGENKTPKSETRTAEQNQSVQSAENTKSRLDAVCFPQTAYCDKAGCSEVKCEMQLGAKPLPRRATLSNAYPKMPSECFQKPKNEEESKKILRDRIKELASIVDTIKKVKGIGFYDLLEQYHEARLCSTKREAQLRHQVDMLKSQAKSRKNSIAAYQEQIVQYKNEIARLKNDPGIIAEGPRGGAKNVVLANQKELSDLNKALEAANNKNVPIQDIDWTMLIGEVYRRVPGSILVVNQQPGK